MDPEKLIRENFDKATRETADRTYFAFADDAWAKRVRNLTSESLGNLRILQSDLADPQVIFNDKKMMFMDGDGFLALTRCYLVAVGLKDSEDVSTQAVVPLDAVIGVEVDGDVLRIRASRAFVPTKAQPEPNRDDGTRITGTEDSLSFRFDDAELWGKLLNKVRFWISAREWDALSPPELNAAQRQASENCLHPGCGKSLRGIFASQNMCPGCGGGFCKAHFGREAVTASMIEQRNYEASETCHACADKASEELEEQGLVPVLNAYREARDTALEGGYALKINVNALITAATKGEADLRQARVDGLTIGWQRGARKRLEEEKKKAEKKGYDRGKAIGKLSSR